MAHVSAQMSQLHMATAFHFLMTKRGAPSSLAPSTTSIFSSTAVLSFASVAILHDAQDTRYPRHWLTTAQRSSKNQTRRSGFRPPSACTHGALSFQDRRNPFAEHASPDGQMGRAEAANPRADNLWPSQSVEERRLQRSPPPSRMSWIRIGTCARG
eukprot:scaffold4390_cov264-Pinguiococcus_pyrenoidosus.AAC.8